MINLLDKFDLKYSNYIHNLDLNHVEIIIYSFGRIFNPDFIFSYLVLILISKTFISNNIIEFIKILLTVIIGLVITLTTKKYFGRPRPEINKEVYREFNLRKHENNNSMPSGDSLQAANFAMILYLYYNIYLSFILFPFVMFSRIYYFCHYIGDTFIGSLMGISISYLIFLCI